MEEAPVCLQYQGTDENDGAVDRVRHAHGLSDDDGGVGRGRGLEDASKGWETTTEASRIQV